MENNAKVSDVLPLVVYHLSSSQLEWKKMGEREERVEVRGGGRREGRRVWDGI